MLDIITGLIGSLLYPLFSILFVVLDTLQGLFRSFAGVGDIYFGSQKITAVNDGTQNGTGLIYHLLTTDLIKNLLISIAILALFLLIIFTVLAFIRNAYSAKPKSWQEIVGNALKGLANFVFIPVMCLLGVWLGNVLLNAIDGATSTGGSMSMSRKVFIACAYDANKYRADQSTDSTLAKNLVEKTGLAITVEDGQDYEYYAEIVDRCYASGNISIYQQVSVGWAYHLFEINYLFLGIAGGFMCYVLVAVVYGMIKRMFMLLILFVISPALCAMYPLDDGKAVGGWKGDFIKQTVSAYGAVAAMNLFMSIMPLIEKINFIGQGQHTGIGTMTDYIVQLLILISGLFVVKDLIGVLSGYVGGDNAFAAGQSLRSSTKGAIKKAGGKVTSVASAFRRSAGAKEAGGSFFGSLTKQATDAAMKSGFGSIGLDTKKIKDAKDEGAKDFIEKGVKGRKGKEDKDKIQDALAGFVGGNSRLTPDQVAARKMYFGVDDAKDAKGSDLLSRKIDNRELSVADLKVDSLDSAVSIAEKSGLSGGALDKFLEELAKNLNRSQSGKDKKIYDKEDISKGISKNKNTANAEENLLLAGEGFNNFNMQAAIANREKYRLTDSEQQFLDNNIDNKREWEQTAMQTRRKKNPETGKMETVATDAAIKASQNLAELDRIEAKSVKFEKADLDVSKTAEAIKNSADAFADTILRTAESMGEAQKAKATEVANLLKSSLNVDPDKLTKAIQEATKAGTSASDKKVDEILKKLKEMLDNSNGGA